jgi:hypothetical protein
MSTALGLGSFNLGGFFDADLSNLLNVDSEHEVPLYAVSVGVPANADRAAQRMTSS